MFELFSLMICEGIIFRASDDIFFPLIYFLIWFTIISLWSIFY